MKNIELIIADKYADASVYQPAGDGIFKCLTDTEESRFPSRHRMTISYELEADEDQQYPLEDILEEYALYVSDFYKEENAANPDKTLCELAGDLEDLQRASEIIGKRVFNYLRTADDGQQYVMLGIE
jgi:hypothetical protein